MPLPLLLFDCDGTLVDSEPLLAEEMARRLRVVIASAHILEIRVQLQKNSQ